MKRQTLFLVIFPFVFGIAAVNAQEKMIFTQNDIVWVDAPPSLPAGVKLAVLEGDPSKFGFFTMRAMLPAGTEIPPHWHPSSEHLTVISGDFNLGFAAMFDKSKGSKLLAGDASIMPAKHIHYAWTDDGCVVQLHGVGPWQLYYVNPDGTTKTETAEKH